ncbi:juvenile hormone acid O-methyltransferase-like [Branchiostoma floridae x Branchiostoma japonicum]
MDMDNAEQYASNRGEQQNVAMDLMNKYVQWQEGDLVLDVGCGTGEVTKFMAKQTGVKAVVGFDLSENFIRFATEHNSTENTSFCVADVSNPAAMRPEWKGFFTKATCFTMLHWIQDKRTCMQNICSCLQPGGQLVVNCLLDTAGVSDIDLPNWRHYLKDFEYTLYPWPSDNIKGMQSLLEECGFKVNQCQGHPGPPQDEPLDEEGWKGVLRPVLSQLKYIPEEKHDDYLAEYSRAVMRRVEEQKGQPEQVVAHAYKI